jgi:pimeloyl-ACP methyl ester carboxylesterase
MFNWFFVVLFTVGAAMAGFAQSGKVQVNGITIAYQSYGSSYTEVILLIAGTNGQLTSWSPEFCNKFVSRGYRVICFDNRDIGLSTKFESAGMPFWSGITMALEAGEKPPLPYSLDDMAKDATALLTALKIKKAHIVGASMGGMIAQRIAYYQPEFVLSLTSMMAGGGRPVFPLVANLDAISSIPPAGAPDDTAAYVQRELQSMKILSGSKYPVNEKRTLALIRSNIKRSFYPDGLVRQGAASMAAFYAGRYNELKTIRVPSLVIHGTDDPLVPVDAGKDVAAAIPGARLELIEGMGHYIPEQLYDTICSLIIANTKRKL